MTAVVDIDKATAVAALRGVAHEDGERTLVHCFRGSFGADWDLEDALALLDNAKQIAWAWHFFGHELAVVDEEGNIYRFNATAPEGVLS